MEESQQHVPTFRCRSKECHRGFVIAERTCAGSQDEGRHVLAVAARQQLVVDRARALQCEFLGKPFSAPALLDRLQLAVRAAGRAPGQRSEHVVLMLGEYRVEGLVHVPVELTRFSDAWEAVVRDPREFLPVTDAKLYSVADGQMLVNAAFIQVRKKDVKAAFTADASRALEA